jgi:hypothetical protein
MVKSSKDQDCLGRGLELVLKACVFYNVFSLLTVFLTHLRGRRSRLGMTWGWLLALHVLGSGSGPSSFPVFHRHSSCPGPARATSFWHVHSMIACGRSCPAASGRSTAWWKDYKSETSGGPFRFAQDNHNWKRKSFLHVSQPVRLSGVCVRQLLMVF